VEQHVVSVGDGKPILVMEAVGYEAAKKVAGDDVIERGSIHKLAAKVWDLNGRSRLYYRR
jgi:hypothetical protein